MVDVRLVELTKDNWRAVAELKVAPHQEGFVADNLSSIAESQFYPHVTRSVITADGEVAGLAVWGMEPGSGILWLHRFMVASAWQQRGIGTESLRQLVARWSSTPGVRDVKVSYEPTNEIAEALYMRFGFVPGDIAEWGERVATLALTDR